MKNYFAVVKTVVAMIMLIPLASCLWRKPVEIVISDKKLILTKTPLTINCPIPFRRTRKSAAILFQLTEDWNIYWPQDGSDRGGIKFKNGKIAFLEVTLVATNGQTYNSNKGQLSGGFTINFSRLPESVKIVKIKVSSSIDVECDKISWYCYDPI